MYIDSSHCHIDSGAHCAFIHASTKVSCVGFMIWCPSGRLPHVVCFVFDQSFHAKSENACLLLVYSFSPWVQSIPWGPRFFARNDTVLRTEYNKSLFTGNYLQNFRTFFILSRATHLCHCEEQRDVAISRKGNRIVMI